MGLALASGRTALVHVRVGLTDMNDISCSLELRRVLAHRFQTLGICMLGRCKKAQMMAAGSRPDAEPLMRGTVLCRAACLEISNVAQSAFTSGAQCVLIGFCFTLLVQQRLQVPGCRVG